MMEAANAHSPFAAIMSASKRKRARSGRDVTDTESVKLQMEVAALQTQLSDAMKKIEELMAVNRSDRDYGSSKKESSRPEEDLEQPAHLYD